ncbi:hypothetical protein AB0M28_18965 [Streptomyces sp. NPDC051940]|uniref:DUF6924 domain-containing protein n=1 Tax=Streptomyces sp. NPDC051940 TaxID=3155675 RepID=UPI003415D961
MSAPRDRLPPTADDAAWAGATPEQVRAASESDEYLSVVFVADAHTMASGAHALLALDLGEEEDKPEDLDPKYYADLILQLTESPAAREFRTTPAALHDVFANLQIANLDFDDFAQEAATDPDGVLRPV